MAAADTVYRLAWGISPQTRDRCLFYARLPRWAGLFYENLAELVVLVVAGVFISVLLERHLSRYSRFIPTNPLAAFFYGALIPVCSCGILPLAARFKERMGAATTISLLVTGPLLSPQIIILSFSVAGPVYGAARIGATLVLALSSILVMGRAKPRLPGTAGCPGGCKKFSGGILTQTWNISRNILPWALLAGSLGILVQSFRPLERLVQNGLLSSPLGVVAATLAGVPVYLCNGADIVFLRPLMEGGLPLGTALAFSLSSSSVCAASLVLMSRLLGKKVTALFLIHITCGTLLLGMILNRFHP